MNTTNKINKKTATILFFIAGIVILSGCSTDFLKPDPLSFYEPSKTFTTRAGLESTIAMCDLHLRSYWTYYSTQDRSLPISTECVFSEEAVGSQTDNTLIFADIANVLTPANGVGDGDDNRIKYFWDQNYMGIKYANTIISNIDNVSGLNDTIKNEFLGRAYFHRAFRYLALIFQFNDVPLVTKILQVPKFNYQTTKREAILEMITADMEKAVQWVPEQSNMSMIGMISKGACRQLLIKCYLATGQYDKAIEQADILINSSGYSLMKNNFGTFADPLESTWHVTENVIWDLHRPDNKCIPANKETILGLPNRHGTPAAIQMNSMRNWLPMIDNRAELKSPAGQNAIVFLAQNNANYNKNLDYNIALGRGIAHIRPTYYYTDEVWSVNGKNDTGDLRHSAAVGNWVTMDSLKYNNKADAAWYGKNLRLYDDNGKLLCTDTIRAWYGWPHYKIYIPNPDQIGNPANAGQTGGAGDWYCYRLAETFLLRAEAKFYKGDIAGATADVNTVRQRAHCNELYSTVTIGDIMDERARELYLEEWRHMELNRVSYCLAKSGKADEFGKTYSVDNLSQDSYWWQRVSKHNNYYNKGSVVWQQGNRPYTIATRNIYWPIPKFAIDANRDRKLRQNPGYDGFDASIPMWTNWQDAVADEDKTTN